MKSREKDRNATGFDDVHHSFIVICLADPGRKKYEGSGSTCTTYR
jgi:hypothetical protein